MKERKKQMMYRPFNEYDEPVNGWFDEMITHALAKGKVLVVDEYGDVWTFNRNGRPCEYVGKVVAK